MKYKAIFFDMGHTLAYREPPREDIFALICAKYGLENLDKDRLRKAFPISEEYFELNYSERWDLISEEEREKVYLELNRMILREAGVDEDKINFLATKIHEEFKNYRRWVAFPDAKQVLAELERDGYILGMVSNWDRNLPILCEELGLADHLRFILASRIEGVRKPNPVIFQRALALAGVKPEEALHLGDSYRADVIGAREVGITPVLIDRDSRYDDELDCIKIESLRELRSVLNRVTS